MKIIVRNIGLYVAAAFILSGCREDLMDTTPYGSISSGNMWTTENLADKGVLGIYSTLRSGNVGSGVFVFDAWGVSADCRDKDDAMLFGNATTGTGRFTDYWKQHYEGIHRANDAIANLSKAPLTEAKCARLAAEAKFLRAFMYYKLNMVYKGVPLYLEPIELEDCVNPRETEARIWEVVISDLTDCINEPNLPARYEKGNGNIGRATKAAAYSLRGKVYLWTKEWAKAETDFKQVGEAGHALFQGEYKQLFKEANEQCEEMIFSVQNIGLSGYGNEMSFRYGSRVAFGSCWNTYLASTDFIDSYECKDGKKFNWDDVIPGYTSMDVKARSVYFLRDNLTEAEIKRMAEDQKADMSKYNPEGNEARILQAYQNRDPRLTATVITPYSQYTGAIGSADYVYTLRWPYRGFDTETPFDVRTDTNNRFYYLFRKFVAEGASEIPARDYSPIDFPLIRYADVLLSLAEALNEQGKTAEAVACANQVRARAGIALLNSNAYTQVAGQDDLRMRIRNERRWEFNGEGVNYFDELRWHTWKDSKFFPNAGLKQVWGEPQYTYSWGGDHYYNWAVPRTETEMNPNIEQSGGWIN
ncbi:SusD family protein [Bacteroidales bacterium Barb6XT]|nr:SusD family protein [Bacteroidales bacterium Barb6XT]